MRRCGRTAALVGIVAGALVAAGLVTPPASATHQNCGDGYPDGTLSNGHPDGSKSVDVGWAGQTALNNIESSLFALSTADAALDESAGIAKATGELLHSIYDDIERALPEPFESAPMAAMGAQELAVRVVGTAIVMARFPVKIAETALLAKQRKVAGSVGGENACNSVLGGDMLDHLWVATVQRNLASDGPPLGVLLTPTDSEEPGGHSGVWPLQPQHEKNDFEWCPPIELPGELPTPAGETDLTEANGPKTGGDCTPGYHDGFLDEPYEGAPRVTVQAIVRDSIDHARAHGLPVRKAEESYAAALADLDAERYKRAFEHFRLAYQAASGQDG